jgi:hypothetical protein
MGKLALLNGVRQERVVNVAAAKPARAIFRKRKKETLYIILEVTGAAVGRDRIYREMIRIIGEEYFQVRGSVTTKLRQAIGSANSFLLQENLSALPHEQRAGGVTCAVLREGNVYIAQAGSTTAYVSYQGELSLFPETPIAELTTEEAAPLGSKRGLPISFYRSKVGMGDVILLTTGYLAREASQQQIAQVVVGKDVDLALANLEELAGEEDTSAMLIRVAPVQERPRVGPEAVRPPARREAEPRPLRQPARPGVEAPVRERLPRPDWSELGGRMSSWLARALKTMGDFLKRFLPEEVPPPSKRVPAPRRPSRPAERGRNLWMGVAIALPIIVVILVAAVYWRQGVARQARFEQLMTQAQQEMQTAGQVEEAAARGYLLNTLSHLAEAEKLRPGAPQVNELREQTDYILKKIDKVTELQWIQSLWEYSEPDSHPSRVIVAKNIDVYVLDKSLDRVYKHLLDETMHALQELEGEPVLLRKGDQRDPIVVGDLVDMAWAKAEGGRLRPSLLVLESGGSLLEYDPLKGISVLPVGGRDRWIEPQIAASYEGDFYLLDSGLNQILRYEPHYDGSPWDYLATAEGVNLAGVVDMAVAGQVYLLYADGRILKFDNGQPAPFGITGLYEPLQSPTALFTSEESQFLYIADRGNRRIVQLTKEGGFVRQLRAATGEALDDLKGLFAIEEFSLLYFVSGNRLYVTNIPSE